MSQTSQQAAQTTPFAFVDAPHTTPSKFQSFLLSLFSMSFLFEFFAFEPSHLLMLICAKP